MNFAWEKFIQFPLQNSAHNYFQDSFQDYFQDYFHNCFQYLSIKEITIFPLAEWQFFIRQGAPRWDLVSQVFAVSLGIPWDPAHWLPWEIAFPAHEADRFEES